MKKTVTCTNCEGSGATRCNKCRGIGYDKRDPPQKCAFCAGEGALKCGPCRGSGQIEV